MADRKSETIRSVAVIGVGSMGNPIAHHLHEAGFDVTACDKSPRALQEFETLGLRTSELPAMVADCDAIIVLVATVKQLQEVAAAIRAVNDGPRYFVVMSTTAPHDMRGIAEIFADTATRIVDAPISGGVVAARKANLTVLAGGIKQDIDALNPIFTAVGDEIFHCGQLGAGQMVKIVNNMIAIGNQLLSAEAYSLGLASGLKLDRLMPALEAGSARNFLSKGGGNGPREAFLAWSKTRNEHDAIKSCSLKDLDLALSLFPSDIAHPAVIAIRNALAGAGDETLANWQRVARS